VGVEKRLPCVKLQLAQTTDVRAGHGQTSRSSLRIHEAASRCASPVLHP
jgi:hypothetical protein